MPEDGDSRTPAPPPASHGAGRAAGAAARARSRRLAALGIATTLLAGSFLGAFALAVLRLGDEPPARSLLQAHAFSQLFGFVLPVAMAMGLRLLPPPPWKSAPRLENALFGLVLAGIVLRVAAYTALGHGAPGAALP